MSVLLTAMFPVPSLAIGTQEVLRKYMLMNINSWSRGRA